MLTPDEREEILREHPEYRWREDDDYGVKTLATDAELEALRNIEDFVSLERLELDYELLGAIIEGFTRRYPNMGEDKRIACASWLRLAFCAGRYYGLAERKA